MSTVRPLVESDLEQLVDLHEKVWPAPPGAAADLATYLSRIFFEGPFSNRAFPSLAFEDRGRIVGLIGSLWRPMRFRDDPIDVVVTHTFMVDPERRSSMAGIHLLQEVFRGRQHLSIAQGNSASAKIWKAVGGESSPLLGLHWLRLLKPLRYVQARLEGRGQGLLALMVAPARIVADPLVALVRSTPVSHERPPGITGEEATPQELLTISEQVYAGRSVVPTYDVETLSWMLDALRYRRSRGSLRLLALREGDGEPIGWLCYHMLRGDISQVVTIGARPGRVDDVLEYLFWDAHACGSAALYGLADPAHLREYSGKQCYFRNDASWFLLHSRNPELQAALHRGDCFMSRMEAEWWIGHEANPPA